jgi:hypothetical protein
MIGVMKRVRYGDYPQQLSRGRETLGERRLPARWGSSGAAALAC